MPILTNTPPFQSHNVIAEQLAEPTLRGYHIGFDQGRFRVEPLVDVVADVIPEFALGYPGHMEVPLSALRKKLKEAANRIYNTDKYKRRGEFGELILHLLLRDHFGSVPLVSKIYFKDSPNDTVKGFDAIHIVETDEESQLWLGESKLYNDGVAGTKALANDVIEHFKAEYLRQEFSLVSAKLPQTWPKVQEWRDRLDQYNTLDAILDRVFVPLVCTYTSPLFSSYSSNAPAYFEAFEQECHSLHESFMEALPTTELDLIFLLLPVECKDTLVELLHGKLKSMQTI